MPMSIVSSVVPILSATSTRTNPRIKKNNNDELNPTKDSINKLNKINGPVGNVFQVVQNDVTFIKTGLSKGLSSGFSKGLGKGLSQGLQWANKAFRIPQVSKSMEDFIWLRKIEDPEAASLQFPDFPQPFYSELSGVDLFMADLKAMEVYIGYFYYLSKMWTKPLPENYDPEVVAEYFMLRPHVVALRLLEVFTAFASTTIKFRISRMSSATNDDAQQNISNYNFGVVLKETMLNLGPTFIKVGQSLSTRPDLIGSEIAKALSELHDQIPPFPREEAMKIIEDELGSPPESYFSYVSEEPVAAASFGQVYKACTCDGIDVAVKVQRPNLRHAVVRDAYLLRLGLGLLQRIAKRKNDLRLYADELGKGLIGELDYTLEAANVLEFKEAHSRFSFIVLPKVYQQLSKKRVLTMEWMVGDRPVDLTSVSSPESRMKLLDLVNKGVEATLIQLLETGIMHADPHPGNLRYLPSGKIGFLDFGLLCRMEKKHQLAMLASIVHIVNGDWGSLVYDLNEMDVIRPGTNILRFTMDLEDSLGDMAFNNGTPDVKFSKVLSKIWSVALKYHCRMPPYYVLVLRSLASLEGLAVAADPAFKTFEAAYPFVVQKLLVDNSAATRKILHSVVFNKSREFQWQRLAVFLRVGATRRSLQSLLPSNVQVSVTHPEAAREVDLANLAVKFLPSKDGTVLRRLLMTADGASLVKAAVSDEASIFRQQFCKILADILYQWMSKAIAKGLNLSNISSAVNNTQRSSTNNEYESILRDRRLRVIFFKALNSAKKNPILMVRFCWTSSMMVLVASALALHRVLVSVSGAYLDRMSVSSKQVAMST